MRIRARLTSALSGLALAVLALSAVITLWSEDRYLQRKDREAQLRTIRDFAAGCGEAMRLKDDQGVVRYVFDVARSSGMAFAGLFLEDGTAIYHTDPALQGTAFIPPGRARELIEGRAMEFAGRDMRTRRRVRIFSEAAHAPGGVRGAAVVGFDVEYLRARRRAALLNNVRRVAWVSVAALALSVVLAFWLAAFLTRPIAELAEGARAIGAGDLGRRIAVRRGDELGGLAAEFNRMAGRLQELDRLKEEFVASMTHELRSPVASIMGFADLLLSGEGGPLTEKQEDWTETLKRGARRLAVMVDNILDAARLETGLMEFSPARVRVEDAAAEAADLFAPLAREQGVALSVRCDGPAECLADPASVAQVLMNLVGNALKFTPEGGEVAVEAKPSGRDLLVRVSDTGPGIPDAAVPRLFSKFFQVAETKDRARRKGSGLGLYICKRLVEAQGGRIWVEKGPKGGAAFCFTLPAPG